MGAAGRRAAVSVMVDAWPSAGSQQQHAGRHIHERCVHDARCQDEEKIEGFFANVTRRVGGHVRLAAQQEQAPRCLVWSIWLGGAPPQ